MERSIGYRLEQYTLKCPDEVLLVTAEIDGISDQVAIFKGFSSSLMQPTAFDPDIPVLPETARILAVDRLKAPFNPATPRYIQQGLTWSEMQSRLKEIGV
jgi:hypothetical protein